MTRGTRVVIVMSMLFRNLDTLRPSDWVKILSHPRKEATRCTSFQIYRNGVLDHVVNGPESLVRNRMRDLRKLFPADSWDYVPARHWLDATDD